MRWGIIGPGKIARKFAEALSTIEGAELYAVASRSLESAETFSKEYGASVFYGNYEAMVKDPLVEMVYVATPHAFHKEHALLCLKNKKPVLCEKPLAHRLSDVKEMIQASVENSTFLMEAMWTRFLPPVNKAMELIASGEIGTPKLIQADFGFASPYNESGRLYDLRLGGGSLLDVGVYPLFLILMLLGKPESMEVTTKLAATGADEWFRAALFYPNANAQLHSSIVEDTPRIALIEGTEGSILFNSPWYRQTSLLVKRKYKPEELIEFSYEGNGFEPQIEEAMNCVRANKIESSLMPHAFSLLQSEVLDELCRKGGLIYS